MKLVGLTGGIGSGKSTVSRILADLNVPIIDADLIARQVVEPGRRAYKLIRNHFGDDILNADGTIDRPKLGAIIFGDSDKRKVLNSCVHPYVRLEMFKQVLWHWVTGAKLVVVDVPLLFESKLYRFVNTTVVVYCSELLQLQRIVKRDNMTEEAATQRIRSQMPLNEKVKLADIVLDNSSDVDQLKLQVKNLVTRLTPPISSWLLGWIVPPVALAISGFVIKEYAARGARLLIAHYSR
ncbi:dephospho-CoA kinase [Umbelopsis sp. PMI_123]|nr:dephospho-CoA kinase [Umbelopsis sp. PMI_123]